VLDLFTTVLDLIAVVLIVVGLAATAGLLASGLWAIPTGCTAGGASALVASRLMVWVANR
jgi:hypothetical protein